MAASTVALKCQKTNISRLFVFAVTAVTVTTYVTQTSKPAWDKFTET